MKFKTKLVLINLTIVFFIAFFAVSFNYLSYRQDSQKKEIALVENEVGMLSENINIAYNEMVTLISNCSERNYMFLLSSSLDQDTPLGRQLLLYYASTLADYCAMSAYSDSIAKLIVYQKNDILVQSGYLYGSLGDAESILNSDFYTEMIQDNSWKLRLVASPFKEHSKDLKLFPLIRPMRFFESIEDDNAWVFLGISPRFINTIISESSTPGSVYVYTHEGDLASATEHSSPLSTDFVETMLSSNIRQKTQVEYVNGQKCITSYMVQTKSGLMVVKILPLAEITYSPDIILHTMGWLFLGCIIIGILLSIFLSIYISKPISQLNNQLKIISGGDFSSEPLIEGNDEFGSIGIHVNNMAAHISELIETKLTAEKHQKHLEFQMLQAQINPHFLYNTLDSIKWIATMQNNVGIIQIVTSLTSLLKHMAKGYHEHVTLKQELELLENYVAIEKIRYVNLFDLEIDVAEESLYQAKIIKMVLQPLVENSIFNGIAPSERPGIIKISISTAKKNLYISVYDNGVGISSEKIPTLLSESSSTQKPHMTGIGLSNVHERIKLVYGEQYGLTIKSELNQYTCLTITVPLQYDTDTPKESER